MRRFRFADYLKEYLDFYKISNKDFAYRIGVTPKHLIDILSGKIELSSNLIESISFVTGVSVDYIYNMELDYKLDSEILDYLSKNNLTITEFINSFNYRYLIDNDWIHFRDKEDKMDIAKDILNFLRVKSPYLLNGIDDGVKYKSKNNKKNLLYLWLEKCYRCFLEQKLGDYKKENIYYSVDYIRDKACDNIFDVNELVKVFNENGIGLVICDDIPGSKIRGAFKVHKNTPCIYITLKYNRIADIYFALLHELAHCKRDFNKAKSISLISFDDNGDESLCDRDAFNFMVDDNYYNIIKNNNDYCIENENIFPKSFVVYRLASDKVIKYSSKEYQDYNIIID